MKDDKHLFFTVKGTTFKICGTNKLKNGKGYKVEIKNVEKKTYVFVSWDKLQKILREV